MPIFMLEHYKAIFDSATMGIIVTDAKGIITNINPFAIKEFNYENAASLIGQKIEHLIPSRFQHSHVRHREDFAQKPQARAMGVGMDLFAKRKDETEFPVEVSLGSFQDKGEKYFIAFISNISIRKAAEAEIEKLNSTLEGLVEERTRKLTDIMIKLEKSTQELEKSLVKEKELGELKSGFVSMASHEFRTPLSAILSSAYLIEKYIAGNDVEKTDKHLQRIISGANMLTDILNDFLSVGKIEEGKTLVKLLTFDVAAFISDITEEMRTTLKPGQQIICTHKGERIGTLDSFLLRHIIHNLISNASKFSPENAEIFISANITADEISLSVKDMGIGIPEEDQKHLLERFFRASNTTHIQGTGLGLHIVSKYAALMNGKLSWESTVGKGSTFQISFKKQTDENNIIN